MSARGITESSMVAFLGDYYSGRIYPGTNGGIVETPCVIVTASDGEETPLGSGNTMIEVAVSVYDEIDDTAQPNSRSRFDDACTAIQNAIRYDDFADQLEAKGAGLSCYGVASRTGPVTERDSESNTISETHTITIYIAEA
jgi:hypothetical protein